MLKYPSFLQNGNSSPVFCCQCFELQNRARLSSPFKAISIHLMQYISLLLVILLLLVVAIQNLPKYLSVHVLWMNEFPPFFHPFWALERQIFSNYCCGGYFNKFFLKGSHLPYCLSFSFSGILFWGQDDNKYSMLKPASPKHLTFSKQLLTGPSSEVRKANTKPELLPPALCQAPTAAACLYTANKSESYE